MAAYALPGIFVMGCLVYFMEPYVIRCPEQSEWNIRAEIQCQNITKYFCLYNYIHYTYEEGCTEPEWDVPGKKRVYSRNFNNAPCNDTRYQPIKFETNGSSDCIFRKSLCTEEGQTLLTNGSTKTDSTCRCDYKQGYAFVTVPRNNCSCRPSEEDCSCYVKKCQEIGYNLSADYECTKDVTKKTVCLLMSENPSEDPHIDMAPTGTPREYDSYAIKRTCDVAILVSIFFLVIIVITICALFHQRLPRCPCLFTNQFITICALFHQRLPRCPCLFTNQSANAESKRVDTGLSLDTIEQNGSKYESAANAESKRMDTGPSLDTIEQNGSKYESAVEVHTESESMDTGQSLNTTEQNASSGESEGEKRTASLDDNASSCKQPRAKQENERMTEATTSRHKSNYIKIATVLLDVSTRAVRVQFDKEFHPVRLQSILKEGLFHLQNLKTKKRITQPQWNLLFPKAGEQPSSKDFDITLMICLLRNLIYIDIMDRLPSATDTSVRADLSRIKYYRNIIVHCDSSLLDDTDFESYWNDVTPAILRLGGNSLKEECDYWYGKNLYAKQRDDGLQSTKVEKRLALVEESLEQIKKWIESDQEKSNPVPNNIRGATIELKGHSFNVDEGKSVAIECYKFIIDKKRPPFWERINEDDETNKLTIREEKKDKYILNSDPPYLRILNAEMSDRGYYRCCTEYSTSNGEEIVRSKNAHLNVEKAVKPGDIHTHIERPVYYIHSNNNYSMDGHTTNITVKNTDKKEQTNTFVGISSSSSSENATPENSYKMVKGRHNSDCGQEPGDADIIKEKRSKMKPVSVTEQVDGLAIKKEKQE